jgi:membrane fusion protein (multidrug efflux system)
MTPWATSVPATGGISTALLQLRRTGLRFVAIAVALLAYGCQQPAGNEAVAAESKQSAVPVTVAQVVTRPAVRVVNFVGTLYGFEEVTLSSQVEGQIESLRGDLGDRVERGQVLAQVDDDQLRARLREAEAMMSKTRADEERAQKLSAKNVISQQELESLRTEAAIAKARRDTLEVTIAHAQVRSPIAGAVSHRFVSIGEYVVPGSKLFTLVALNPLKLRGDVPERFAHEIRPEQTVNVTVDPFPDVTFEGRVARISPASDPQSRSVALEVLVDNFEEMLKPGFFAHARVITRQQDRALMVPQEALISFAGVTKVFVVRDSVAEERQVTTGTRGDSGLVEVVEGLREGEHVALSGITKLANGTPVDVRLPDRQAPEPSRPQAVP